MELNFTQVVYPAKLQIEIEAVIPEIDYITTIDDAVTISFTKTLTQAEQDQVTAIMAAHTTEYVALEISSFGITRNQACNSDFTILGLVKASPEYDKGKKLSVSYFTDETETTKVVSKSFADRLDVDGKLVGLDISFDWFDTNGDISLTKVDFKPLSQYEGGELLKKRRDRQIDYLVEGAKGTAGEPLVTTIFDHYKDETISYIAVGSIDLFDAVTAEADATILGYLNTVINPVTGATVKDSILYQIT